jgi:ribonuclease P protein component
MLNLRFSERDAKKPYRVAVVASRKVSKSAVTRNRIRRRIYAAVRESDVTIAPGTDLVFTVFSDRLAELPTPELREIVAELLKKTAKPAAGRH